MTNDKPAGLSSELYGKDYYDKTLPGLEYLGRDVMDQAAEDTIRFGEIKSGEKVLDFGCGRGSLVLELAKRGVQAAGMDFSEHAISFAKDLVLRFPAEIQNRVSFRQMTIEEFDAQAEFDVVVFNQVYEHLYDHELAKFLSKFKRALKPNGRLVISTPNLDYVRYLYPLKRITEFPFKIIKECSRLLRGKSKHAVSFSSFFKEIFKIRYPESEHTKLHVNLQTPRAIEKFIKQNGFTVQVNCVDRHSHLASQMMRTWWGETIWVAARPS